jgi:hypothetical protein
LFAHFLFLLLSAFSSRPEGFRLPLAFESLAIGTAVVRGPDWKWGDQDGGGGGGTELCRGVTTSNVDEAGWVSVAWRDASGALSASRWYRVGASARCAGADIRPRFDIFAEERRLPPGTKAPADSADAKGGLSSSMDHVSWKVDEGLGNDIQLVDGDNRNITRTNSSSWGTQVSGAFEGDCEITLKVKHPSSDYLYIGVLNAPKVETSTWKSSSSITGSKRHIVYYKADGSMQSGEESSMSGGPTLRGEHTLTIKVEMSAMSVTFAIDGVDRPPLAIKGDAWDSTRLFACFGSSNQYVEILDVVGSFGDSSGSAWWLGDGDAQSAALTARVHSSIVGAAPATVASGNRAVEGECSFMYRYILRESCSQFDSLPLTSLTISRSKRRSSTLKSTPPSSGEAMRATSTSCRASASRSARCASAALHSPRSFSAC